MANDNSKLIAILSYITPVGWIIALVMNLNAKTSLGSFHIRQTLLLYLLTMVFKYFGTVGYILDVFIFAFWVMGIITAVQGTEKPVPFIGKYAQDWFKSL